MRDFFRAFSVELLKARRSKLWIIVLAGFTILPLVAGLFMIILKDPEAAKEMGIISMKAQLMAGVADWPTHFGILNMGTAVAGSMLFSIITAWVFGREFFNRTSKELLALPVGRSSILSAKFVLVFFWTMLIALYIYALGVGIGFWVNIPGWSRELAITEFKEMMLVASLTALLMPVVAFFSSVGRGYLAALGWAFFGLASANIMAVLGWGDLYPWSIPVIITEMVGPGADSLTMASYVSVGLAGALGLLATYTWWARADHSR